MSSVFALRACLCAALAVAMLAACQPRQTAAPLGDRPNMALQGEPVIAVAGDTVYTLARRYKVSVRAVIDANGLRPPYQLYPGQTIYLPRVGEHIVVAGETLSVIAQRYKVDVREFARANDLKQPYVIKVGQRLRLPAPAEGTQPAASQSVAAQKPPEPKPAPAEQPTVQEAAAPGRPAKPAPGPLPEPPPLAGGFVWPAKGEVVARYGTMGKGLQNDGINIAVPRGAPIKAVADGVVAYAGNELRGFGNLLLIKHADGWMSAYAHLDDLHVGRGAVVKRGQTIAKAGSSGSVRTPQLHFELRKGASAVDPLRHLPTEQALGEAAARG